MLAHSILFLLVLQPVSAPSSAGEESLVWTELADPDPYYVPPPPTAEQLAARRAERARAAERRRLDEKLRQVEERINAQLRRACETIRTAQISADMLPDPPTCSR